MSAITPTYNNNVHAIEFKQPRKFNRAELIILFVVWNYGFAIVFLLAIFGLCIHFWNEIIAFGVPPDYVPQCQAIPLGGKTFLILSGPAPASLKAYRCIRRMSKTENR
jgi:hypothetical protein